MIRNVNLLILCVFFIFASCSKKGNSLPTDKNLEVSKEKIIQSSDTGNFVSENVIAIEKDKRYVLYNINTNTDIADVLEYSTTDGKIIPVIFDIDDRNLFSFINENGEILYNLKIRKCYGFYEGFAVVMTMDFGFAFIDATGHTVMDGFEQLGQKFSEGKNQAKFSDLSTGIINNKGEILFKVDIDKIDGFLAATKFYKDVCLAKKNNKEWNLITGNGEIIKTINLKYAYDYTYGYSCVYKENDKYNFVDTEGNFFSGNDFDKAEPFQNGSSKVIKNNKEYILKLDGSLISMD